VPGLDAGLEGTTAYLASEYVAAETLDVALRHLAPAPIDRALPILEQIADAIDAAWAAGLGHGALHPRDVFVTADATVRLTGFGVVQAMDSIGVKAPVRRPYTAPERVTGDAWDVRADVYSLGAIAHELLTGRRPSGSGEQDGALTTGTSPEQRIQIRRVLSASLAEHAQHRFQSARAFVDALAAVARGDVPVTPIVEVEEDQEEPEDLAPLLALADETQELAPAPAIAPATLPPTLPVPVPAPAAAEPLTAPLAALPPAAADVASAPRMWQPAASELSEPAFSPSTDGRFAPGFGGQSAASHPALEEHHATFPWAMASLIGAAGIAIGLVIGYGAGKRAAPAGPDRPAASAQTDVPVVNQPAPEPAPPAPPPANVEVGAPPATAPSRGAIESGRLIVRSTPPGALVTVDGRVRGQTPLTVSNLTLGKHTLEVGRSGFVPHREDVVLTAGTSSRTLSVRLQAGLPMPGAGGAAPSASATLGAIFVDSRPQAARVIIDGRFVGVTPLRVPEMSLGMHTVRLERTGYFSFSTTVAVKAGEPARVTAALEQR
jgi:hypothetical protein